MLRKPLGSALLAAALTTALSLPAGAQIEAELVATGLSSPLFVTAPNGDTSGRLWVVEKRGTIQVIQNGSNVGTYLNIDPLINSSGERGLLGMAFHPDYLTNGKFYVSYTNNSGNSMLVEYSVSGDPLTSNTADSGSANTIIGPINQDFSNHNGGCIQFGPDGKLYMGLGDGGSGDDPFERAQDINSLLGKILRFDVDIASPYIPNDNPFFGAIPGRDEIWMTGQRNPWRFSFDRQTGDLYIGDVGQNAGSGREEINFAAGGGSGGENMGWDCKYGSVSSTAGDVGCSASDPTLIDPIHEYTTNSNGGSRSITGGYVYRGSAIPSLQGTYFFADYQSSRIWSFEYNGSSVSNFTDRTTELEPDSTPTITLVPSFGEDADGELYICDMADGEVYKIVEPCPVPVNTCQSVQNSSGTLARMAWSGSTSHSANNLTLVSQGCPANQSGVMIASPAALPGSGTPLGNGNLCLDSAPLGFVVRLAPSVTTDFLGIATLPFDNTTEIATGVFIGPGETWYFSFWFRDIPAGGAGFNFADALCIQFCP